MVWGTVHPRWLGWSLLGLGVLTAILAIVAVVTGASAPLMFLLAGLIGLTSLWVLVFGIWLWRKAW